jgi:hypothetical protein
MSAELEELAGCQHSLISWPDVSNLDYAPSICVHLRAEVYIYIYMYISSGMYTYIYMYRYIIYCWFSYLYIPHRLCLQWVLHTPKIGVHQARHLIAGCRRGVFLHLQGFVSEDRVSIFCTKKQQHKKNQISSCRVYYSMAHQRGLYHVIMSATSRTKSEPSAALTQVFSVE